MLTLRNEETGILDVYALHSTDSQLLESSQGAFQSCGHAGGSRCSLPGSPWWPMLQMSTAIRIRIFGGLWQLGLKSICSVPLIITRSHLGTLALSRMTNR